MKKPKRPKDIFERAKLIGDISVGLNTEENAKLNPTESQLNSRKGGVKRAQNLSPERRKEIAKNAVSKRWSEDN